MKFISAKSLVVALVALLGFSQLSMAQERVVATIDGHMIMESQVKKALGKKANTEANRKKALDQVIDDFIVQRAIKESGLQINYDQVDYLIEAMAMESGLTYGQLLDALDYQGITYEQYRQQVAHQLLMEEVKNISIGKSIQVDPQEVQKTAKEMLDSAKSKGTLKKVMGTEHRVSHILIKLTPILNDNQAKAKLNQIVADIKSGKTTFEEAAKLNSVDYLSGADGGDLGWNFLTVYDQKFAEVAKKSKVGVVSAPFKSQFGWHILKVTDTRQGDRTEDAYLQKAYEKIVNKQAQEASKDWVKALRKIADIKYIEQ